MNKDYEKALRELLDSECLDYYIKNEIESDEAGYATVTLSHNIADDAIAICFKWSDETLYIDMYEDAWIKIEWWTSSVKYFWMLVAAVLFCAE